MIRLLRSVAVATVGILMLTGAAVADPVTHDTSTPSSYHVVVDKHHPLRPKSYAPRDLVHPKVRASYAGALLRKVPARQVERMFAAYHRQTGRSMQILSAYRPYASQKRIYNGYVAAHGRAWADRGSARPGFSEHQTGLALDIGTVGGGCALGSCFARTSQGRWLAKNAWKYGFVLRYPNGYEKVTGYKYEPWHYRYVGLGVATAMHRNHVMTLEQYFGYAAAPTYL